MASSSEHPSAPAPVVSGKRKLPEPDFYYPSRTPSRHLSDRALALIPTLIDRLVEPGRRVSGLPLPVMSERTRAHKASYVNFLKSWIKETEAYDDLELSHDVLKKAYREGIKSRGDCKNLRRLITWFENCKKRWLQHLADNEAMVTTLETYRAFQELLKSETDLILAIGDRHGALPEQGRLERWIEQATRRDLRGLIDLWHNRVEWTHRFNEICDREVLPQLEEQDRLNEEARAQEEIRMKAWREEEAAKNAAKVAAYWELNDRVWKQNEAVEAVMRKQRAINEARKKQEEAVRQMEQARSAPYNANPTTGRHHGARIVDNQTQQLDRGEWEQEQARLRLQHQAAEQQRSIQLQQQQRMSRPSTNNNNRQPLYYLEPRLPSYIPPPPYIQPPPYPYIQQPPRIQQPRAPYIQQLPNIQQLLVLNIQQSPYIQQPPYIRQPPYIQQPNYYN